MISLLLIGMHKSDHRSTSTSMSRSGVTSWSKSGSAGCRSWSTWVNLAHVLSMGRK